MTKVHGGDLDLRLVRYFVAVAETLHFGQAATALHIAQPSLSAQIRALEARLGAQLFDRNSRHVELTSAGTRFYQAALPLLAASDAALRAATGGLGLRLATILDGLDTVPLLVKELPPEPHIPVSMGISGMPAQLHAVRSGRLDAALGMRTELPRELDGLLVRRDPVRILVRADSDYAAHSMIHVSQLRGASWVLGSTEHTPDWVEFLRVQFALAEIDVALAGAGQVPLSAMMDEVLRSGAVAPWPDSCPRPGEGLVVRDLEPMPIFEWQLVWLKSRTNDPAIQLIRNAALQAASRHSWLGQGSPRYP